MKKGADTSKVMQAEVELCLQKIRQKVASGPEWSKKAAVILSKMIWEKKDFQ